MSRIKHIQLQHELPIGQRFTLDTWPDKTFEVVKAEGQEKRDRAFRIDRCDGCFFQHGRLVKDGYVDDCGTFLLCNGNDRQDKTYVVFEEVEEGEPEDGHTGITEKDGKKYRWTKVAAGYIVAEVEE